MNDLSKNDTDEIPSDDKDQHVNDSTQSAPSQSSDPQGIAFSDEKLTDADTSPHLQQAYVSKIVEY